MDILTWTWIMVGLTFSLYIGIAVWSRAGSTGDFYVAGGGVPPVANGMATAADWMSAASYISMAGLISFLGYDGSMYLMGWTGGYVLLTLLLAPYLRKFGQFTVPDFIGTRYYSSNARLIALICAIFVSFTYVAGQMRGVGVVFSRFLEVDVNTGVLIGMAIVFFYATLGGMKGITYTQVAQYCVMIVAYLVPAFFLSAMMTDSFLPQIGFFGNVKGTEISLLDKLDGLHAELGFAAYTEGQKSMIDIFFITMALMVGTAGLPHVIIRFFTVPKVSDARTSGGWALLFITLLYTTAPAIAAFARVNAIESVYNTETKEYVAYQEAPQWVRNWEKTGLIAWMDKNGDGKIQYVGDGAPFKGKPSLTEDVGDFGQVMLNNEPTAAKNEFYIDRDIIVLANPEIANLPNWVIALMGAGGLAAALSTAAGLLLVISTSVSHDLMKSVVKPDMTEKEELMWARVAAGVAVAIAGYFGINPPGFVAQVVAFAFGLAAASFFPAILLGIFTKSTTREGAMAGMVSGIVFTAAYIIYFKFINPAASTPDNWLFGISPEGIGTLGMLLNFVVSIGVSRAQGEVPDDVQQMIDDIRIPSGAGEAVAH
jgi:cation/acetate symporter